MDDLLHLTPDPKENSVIFPAATISFFQIKPRFGMIQNHTQQNLNQPTSNKNMRFANFHVGKFLLCNIPESSSLGCVTSPETVAKFGRHVYIQNRGSNLYPPGN